VRRLRDDLHVGLGVEHRSQPLEHDRMIVRDEHTGLQDL